MAEKKSRIDTLRDETEARKEDIRRTEEEIQEKEKRSDELREKMTAMMREAIIDGANRETILARAKELQREIIGLNYDADMMKQLLDEQRKALTPDPDRVKKAWELDERAAEKVFRPVLEDAERAKEDFCVKYGRCIDLMLQVANARIDAAKMAGLNVEPSVQPNEADGKLNAQGFNMDKCSLPRRLLGYFASDRRKGLAGTPEFLLYADFVSPEKSTSELERISRLINFRV